MDNVKKDTIKPLVLNKETIKSFVGAGQLSTFSGVCYPATGVCTFGCPETYFTTTMCGSCNTGCGT